MYGQVEQYLTDIINKMRGELREITDRSVKAYPTKPRDEWIFDWPSQIILVVNQIYWCLEVEEAFQKLEKGQKNAMQVRIVADANEYCYRQVGTDCFLQVTAGILFECLHEAAGAGNSLLDDEHA